MIVVIRLFVFVVVMHIVAILLFVVFASTLYQLVYTLCCLLDSKLLSRD